MQTMWIAPQRVEPMPPMAASISRRRLHGCGVSRECGRIAGISPAPLCALRARQLLSQARASVRNVLNRVMRSVRSF